MSIFISIICLIQIIFLWSLLIQNKKSMSDEERIIEDQLQMQYLKEYRKPKIFGFFNN